MKQEKNTQLPEILQKKMNLPIKEPKQKDCSNCKCVVEKNTNTGTIYFCGATGKLILYPKYVEKNCGRWVGHGSS